MSVMSNEFLTVNRLEFVVTYLCNSQCKHCQVENDKRSSSPAAIDRDLAVEIVQKITNSYSPTSIMTFGGEPLLYSDTVCAIHESAREGGIPQRQVITNAGYPTSEENFQKVALKLAESGVNNINVSVDGFHQEYIPLHVVERNVQALINAGIEEIKWNPCWLISKQDNNQWNQRTKSILRDLSHLPVPESDGNIVQPNGNALIWLRDAMPSKIPMPSGSCGSMPYTGTLDEITCPSIGPDGSVEVCNEFAIGNAHQSDILDIVKNYDPYQIPEMKVILESGMDGLVKFASAKGITTNPEGYYSICDMCQSIRRGLSKQEELLS